MPAADITQTQRAPQAAQQQAATYFGGRTYTDLLPEINSFLGIQSGEPQIANAAVRNVDSGGRPIKEATFSVASSETTPLFRVVHYDDLSRGSYNYTAPTGSITKPVSSNELEISVRQENGRDIYTVRTTAAFSGALKIESAEGTLTVYSHGDSPATTTAQASDPRPSPAAQPALPLSDSLPPALTRAEPTFTRQGRSPALPQTPERELPVERQSRPSPAPYTPDPSVPQLSLPPEIETPRPQISLAGLDSTPIERRPTELPAHIELPEPAAPTPESRPAPRNPFRRAIGGPRPQPEPETIERPNVPTPRREPRELSLSSLPVPPLPDGPATEKPELAQIGPRELDVRIAPGAPITDIPLPEAPANEPPPSQAPPRSRMPRTELADRGPEQPPSPERPRQNDLPDPVEHPLPQLPPSETPAEVPQLAVISSVDSDVRRAPAPAEPIEAEMGLPDERAKQQQTAQTTRPAAPPEKREPSKLDKEIADVEARRRKAERESEELARKLQASLEVLSERELSRLSESERMNRFRAFQGLLNSDNMTLPTDQWADRVLTATGNNTPLESVLDLVHRGKKDTLMPDFQRYRMLRHNIGELNRTNTRLQGLRAAENSPAAESAQATPSSR